MSSNPIVEFEKLEIFVLVAECGSLSKAAVLSHVGPSGLSRQLAALEAECGGRCFIGPVAESP